MDEEDTKYSFLCTWCTWFEEVNKKFRIWQINSCVNVTTDHKINPLSKVINKWLEKIVGNKLAIYKWESNVHCKQFLLGKQVWLAKMFKFLVLVALLPLSMAIIPTQCKTIWSLKKIIQSIFVNLFLGPNGGPLPDSVTVVGCDALVSQWKFFLTF